MLVVPALRGFGKRTRSSRLSSISCTGSLWPDLPKILNSKIKKKNSQTQQVLCLFSILEKLRKQERLPKFAKSDVVIATFPSAAFK